MPQFLDLIQTESVVIPVFLACLVLLSLLVLFIWVYFTKDDSDTKLERMEQERSANLKKRMAEDGDQESQLGHFHDTGELLPQQRMDTLTRSAEAPGEAWIDGLATRYQFNLEVDADRGVVRLYDRRFFALKNKVIELPVSRVLGADYKAAKKLLMAARSNMNRRAQNQGIIPVKHRQA